MSYDVIIIGGGHNGLTTAAYLARAGRSVVVLEKNSVVGGCALTEEFHPGFRNSVAAYTVSLLNPKVIKDLELKRFGLEIVLRPASNFWPVDDKRYLLMRAGTQARQQAVAAFSEKDAEQLPLFDAAIERAANVLRDLVLETPPNVGGGLRALWSSGRLARRLLRLSQDDQRFVTDLFTKSATDVLDAWFESDVVKGALAFDGIVGAYAAPSTPGTAYVLLHHAFGEVNGVQGQWGHAIGGMGAITQAMAKSAAAYGAEIRTQVSVEEILVEDGRASGVRLADGNVLRAKVLAANVGPKLLFRDLLARDLPETVLSRDLRRRFETIKTGSGTFRMNVALKELPDFICCPGREKQDHHGAGIIIGPTLNYLEQAYLDARRDGWSNAPVVEMLIPSTLDTSLAPPGQHVASLFVQHVAPTLPEGRCWCDPTEKTAFADKVIETVTSCAPNFADAVIGRQILSPLDLETRFGLVDGDIFHGQLGLDQLFSTRPQLGYADYRMPIPGLYLCGSGAHPGGGVTGAPGHNAAREILRDFGWSLRKQTH